MNRRRLFFQEIPGLIGQLDRGGGVRLRDIYGAIESEFPASVDTERELPPGHGLKWKHDVRWEIETLVAQRVIVRRKDLGRPLPTNGQLINATMFDIRDGVWNACARLRRYAGRTGLVTLDSVPIMP